MKHLTAFALVVLSCAPATAQQPTSPRPPIENELLEMEQDVDKTLLREALLLQGRMGMKVGPEGESAQKQSAANEVALRDFIARKKESILARAAELAKGRGVSRRASTQGAGAPSNRPAEVDRASAIEKIEEAQIETQLLQAQVNLLQRPMSEAITALAAAEFAASNDETQRAKAEAARKEYEKVKARYVEQSKRLQVRQHELQSMQQLVGMGGFGGGFR